MSAKFPKWSLLRTVGNLTAVRLTVLIPLVGYLIIFNENVVKYLDLAKEFAGISNQHFASGISPKLLLIYFGLCALAAGSAIFSIWCPAEVKHYGTSAAYVGGDGHNIGDFAFEPIETRLRNSANYTKEYQRIRDRYEPKLLSIDYTIEQKREDMVEAKVQINNGILHLYFAYLDNSHPIPRLLTAIFFAIGFIALAVPSAQVFLKVTQLLISSV